MIPIETHEVLSLPPQPYKDQASLLILTELSNPNPLVTSYLAYTAGAWK